ncbi:HA1F protein, partial [Cnemophilus loriae]|nr:HA1F protein [Cnemophilus loriae]
RSNPSPGLHTLQEVFGCDLLSDGRVHRFDRLSYDGREFLSFKLGSGRFVVADGAAQITKRRWQNDEIKAEELTNDLGHTCLECLWKYVRYRQKALEHKAGEIVFILYIFSIYVCHTYGFYPSTIRISWMKGNEIWDQEMEWGGIIPNSDGTFHTWARMEALPEEREQHWCRVEHPRMPEPGIFAWEPESSRNLSLVIAVSVIAAIDIILLIRFGVWKLQSGSSPKSILEVA